MTCNTTGSAGGAAAAGTSALHQCDRQQDGRVHFLVRLQFPELLQGNSGPQSAVLPDSCSRIKVRYSLLVAIKTPPLLCGCFAETLHPAFAAQNGNGNAETDAFLQGQNEVDVRNRKLPDECG